MVRILGLMMLRNCEESVRTSLDAMAEYCDSVCVVDDRSTDRTAEIATNHPIVYNVVRARPQVSAAPWYFEESLLLKVLYHMADLYKPDWIVRLDHDEHIEPARSVRPILEAIEQEVVGVRCSRISTWDDVAFPRMVPLMGTATSLQGAFWRHLPGLTADKPLHNPRMPAEIENRGGVVECTALKVFHSGWSTLAKRVERAKFYTRRDLEQVWNFGVDYGRGLLFGYSLSEIDELIAEYERRSESVVGDRK